MLQELTRKAIDHMVLSQLPAVASHQLVQGSGNTVHYSLYVPLHLQALLQYMPPTRQWALLCLGWRSVGVAAPPAARAARAATDMPSSEGELTPALDMAVVLMPSDDAFRGGHHT